MANLPQRKSIRLKNYNYSADGFYFVTICTQNRRCLFGDIVGADPRVGPYMYMNLNEIGQMVEKWWLKIPKRFQNVKLDTFQIMPNHIHGIIVITNGSANDGRTHGSAPTDWIPTVGVNPRVDPINPTLGTIIQWFKTMTTNNYICGVKNHGWQSFDKRVWQRNYYEHIIRTKTDLNKIRQYIQNNSKMWDRDRNNPKNFKA